MKNFPTTYTEENLREIFGKFGDIKSLIMMKKTREGGEESAFAFVCYENSKNPLDKEYGPKAAMAAVAELNEKEIEPGCKLYVREALKKAEREIEKKKDQMRFKNSKKRCNLYVKNFPPNTTDE